MVIGLLLMAAFSSAGIGLTSKAKLYWAYTIVARVTSDDVMESSGFLQYDDEESVACFFNVAAYGGRS